MKMKESEAVAIHSRKVIENMNSFLEPRGFISKENFGGMGKYRIKSWRREVGWKTDVVQLSLRIGTGDFGVALLVYIPDSDIEHILDIVGVSDLVGKSGSYHAPSILGRIVAFGAERFAKRVVADTAKAMRWFAKFETPEKCIAQLETEETDPKLRAIHDYWEKVGMFSREKEAQRKRKLRVILESSKEMRKISGEQ